MHMTVLVVHYKSNGWLLVWRLSDLLSEEVFRFKLTVARTIYCSYGQWRQLYNQIWYRYIEFVTMQAMKLKGEGAYRATLTLDGGEYLASRLNCFTPGVSTIPSVFHWSGPFVEAWASLSLLEMGTKFLCFLDRKIVFTIVTELSRVHHHIS